MWENLAIGSVGYIAAVDLAREPIDFRRAGGTGPVVLVANALTMPADWMPSRSVNREIVLAADTVRITPPLERSRSSSGLARAVVIARAVQGADELSPALRIYQAAPKSKCSGPVRGFAEKAPVWCADDATRARPSLAGVLETAAQRFEAHVVPAELSPWEAAGFQQWARSWLGGQVARQSAWNDALAEKASETGIAQLGDASSSIIAYVFGETRSICPNPRVLLDVHPAGEGDRVRAPMMTVSTLAGARSFTIVQFSGRIVPDFDDADTVRKTLDLPPGWEVRCALDGAAKISAVVFDELQPASGSVNGDSVRVSVSAEDESILDRAYVRFASDAVQLEIDLPSKDVMWLGGIGFSSRYDARVQLAADRIMNSGLGTVAVEALAGVSGGKCLLRDGDGQMPEVAELTSAGVAARCRGPRWALDPRLMIYRDADPDAVAELAEGPAIRLFVVVNALQAIASDGVTHVTLAMKQGARSLPVISLLPGEARAVPLSGATVEPIEIAGVAYTISGAQALFRYVAEPATGTFYLDASVL